MYQVNMGGSSQENEFTKESDWNYDDTIQAVAYDIPITGFNTFNTNNLRLWRSRPCFEEEEESAEDLVDRIDKMQDAEYLTSIYYPNIPDQMHKETRLR